MIIKTSLSHAYDCFLFPLGINNKKHQTLEVYRLPLNLQSSVFLALRLLEREKVAPTCSLSEILHIVCFLWTAHQFFSCTLPSGVELYADTQ